MTALLEQLAGKRVMVVNADSVIARMIADTLVEAGALPPIVAASAAEAVARLADAALDAAIVDTGLPDETASVIAYRLFEHNVPFACTVEASVKAVTARGAQIPVLHHPVQSVALIGIVQRLVAAGAAAAQRQAAGLGTALQTEPRTTPT